MPEKKAVWIWYVFAKIIFCHIFIFVLTNLSVNYQKEVTKIRKIDNFISVFYYLLTYTSYSTVKSLSKKIFFCVSLFSSCLFKDIHTFNWSIYTNKELYIYNLAIPLCRVTQEELGFRQYICVFQDILQSLILWVFFHLFWFSVHEGFLSLGLSSVLLALREILLALAIYIIVSSQCLFVFGFFFSVFPTTSRLVKITQA